MTPNQITGPNAGGPHEFTIPTRLAARVGQFWRWASIIRLTIRLIGFTMACSVIGGCSERERVGGGYVLVTPATLGPDHHPGTSLQRNGKTIWANVYVGYFHPHDSRKFFHEGMFVFVAPVPGDTDWSPNSQVFAVRGGGTPVVLSERLLGAQLGVSLDYPTASSFAVRHIEPSASGVRIEFEYWVDASTRAMRTNDLAWPEIKRLLEEADSSTRDVHHNLGDYRILPPR